jgi:hypothetical protein
VLAEVGCPFSSKPFRLEQFLDQVQRVLQETEPYMARLAVGLKLLTEKKADLAAEKLRGVVASS